MLRSTPKPKLSTRCHGCTINREQMNSTGLVVRVWLIILQDGVEVLTKAIAFSTLPWMHHQQRIKEFNRTRCTRVVDRSKMLLRYTPKPKPSTHCHGCTINRESRNSTGPIVHVWLIILQDYVEVHTKAKAFSMLPWMHHQQRIKDYNRTHCTHVDDRSKIVLRYTPKPLDHSRLLSHPLHYVKAPACIFIR